MQSSERYHSADECEHGNRRPQYQQQNQRNEHYSGEYSLDEFQSDQLRNAREG